MAYEREDTFDSREMIGILMIPKTIAILLMAVAVY
jgi:hypothetical protein